MVRNGGNYDRKAVSDFTAVYEFGRSRTIQSQKAEADINTIVRNFGVTGKVPQNVRVPTYGDFHGPDDYRSALEFLKVAQSSFDAMPVDLRKRFNNDPALFVGFCADEANLEEMRKLGLAVPPPVVLDSLNASGAGTSG